MNYFIKSIIWRFIRELKEKKKCDIILSKVDGFMEFILSLLNSFSFLFKSIKNLFKSFTVNINGIECVLDKPAAPDGEGGYINGSYAYFRIEIINRKDKKFILEKLHCKAMSQNEILLDHIHCYNKNSCEKIATKPIYDELSFLNIQPQSSVSCEVKLTPNGDLSKCDKLVFFYKKGIRQKKIVIWEKE